MAHTVSIKGAIMNIFHVACPLPHMYMREDGFDTKQFILDREIWMAAVIATWQTLPDTGHTDECRCCICFQFLCTNHENDFQRKMKLDYTSRRVSRLNILRWSALISTDGPKEAFASILAAAKAYLKDEQHDDLQDVSVDSEALSNVLIPSESESSEQEVEGDEDWLPHIQRPESPNQLQTPKIAKSKRKHQSKRTHKRRTILSRTDLTPGKVRLTDVSFTAQRGAIVASHYVGINTESESSERGEYQYSLRSHSSTRKTRERKQLKSLLETTIEIQDPGRIAVCLMDQGKIIAVKATENEMDNLTISTFLSKFMEQLPGIKHTLARHELLSQTNREKEVNRQYRTYSRAKEKLEAQELRTGLKPSRRNR